jgi:hypothetical protein
MMAYEHQSLLREIDTYKDTVSAIVAFIHECRWDQNNRVVNGTIPFGVGRLMRNAHDDQLTPDIVIQRHPTQGVVAEVKTTFPPDNTNNRRDEVFQQLKSYDVELFGWWSLNGQVERHDIVLLTHDSHVVDATDHFVGLAGKEIGRFERNLAFVGFYRSEQHHSYITLRKHSGDLLDHEFSSKLRRSVPIEARHIEQQQKKFYDGCPPIPYLLSLMWTFLFPTYAEGQQRDARRGFTPVEVTSDQVTTDLQRYYGFEPDAHGNRGIPRGEWIEEALEALVSFRMAQRGNGPRRFVIRYKGLTGDVLERFGRLFHERREKESQRRRAPTRQPTLFDNL